MLPLKLKRAVTHGNSPAFVQDYVTTVTPVHPNVTKCTFAIALLFSAFRNSGYVMTFFEEKLKILRTTLDITQKNFSLSNKNLNS